jgi:flagellar basal body-associated protein FliL
MQMNCNREEAYMLKKLLQLVTIMFVLSAIGAVIIAVSGKKKETEVIRTDDKIRIVTTIYPVNQIGLNITDKIDNIVVSSLIDRNVG